LFKAKLPLGVSLSGLLITTVLANPLVSKVAFRQRFESLLSQHHAIVGVSVVGSNGTTVSINGNRGVPMQSVMKLLVAAATLENVDRGWQRLDGEVVIRKQDRSLAGRRNRGQSTNSDRIPTTIGCRAFMQVGPPRFRRFSENRIAEILNLICQELLTDPFWSRCSNSKGGVS
jgi:hypothetical protein